MCKSIEPERILMKNAQQSTYDEIYQENDPINAWDHHG